MTTFFQQKLQNESFFPPTCSHDVRLTTEVLRLECGKFLYSSHSFWNRRGGALTLGVPGPAEVPKICVGKKKTKQKSPFERCKVLLLIPHWLRLKWCNQKCEGTSSIGFDIKWLIGTYGNWKNQTSGSSYLEVPAITALQIWPIWPNFEVNGLDWQCCLAPKQLPGFSFFQLSWMPITYIYNPLLLLPSHFLGILFQS